MANFQKGQCEHCHREFNYQLWHAGFSDISYAYCNACGAIATFSYQTADRSHLPPITAAYREISKEFEPLLNSCACGGRFKKGASPRCPHCNLMISADDAASYIEANAPGTAKGWRWQRNWSGLYCIAIEDASGPGSIRCVMDPYLHLDLYSKREIGSR
jgi:hypothetical protein